MLSGSGVMTMRSMPDAPSSTTSGTGSKGEEKGVAIESSKIVRMQMTVRSRIRLPGDGGYRDRFLSSLLMTTPMVSFRTIDAQHRACGFEMCILQLQ